MRLTTVLQVHMDPNQDIIYSRGSSKSVAPIRQMIDTFGDKWDPKYVPSCTHTPTSYGQDSRGTARRWLSIKSLPPNLMMRAH